MKNKKNKDVFTRTWITENALQVIENYELGILTLRALHYQLVALGMTNTIQHYKRVVAAMIQARWEGKVRFDTFSDHDREVIGATVISETLVNDEIESSKGTIEYIMTNYHKNSWENQPCFVEVWIEKKALQGVFGKPCRAYSVALAPCKGYPSLTFLHDASKRFIEAIDQGKKPVILYFGDYDASGEDIPRSVKENLESFGAKVEVKRIALMEHQVLEWNLPPAPTKEGDSRAKKWEGLGQVELDAVKPEVLQTMCEDAIEELFDRGLYAKLLQDQETEKKVYVSAIKEYVNSIAENDLN